MPLCFVHTSLLFCNFPVATCSIHPFHLPIHSVITSDIGNVHSGQQHMVSEFYSSCDT